MRRTAAVILVPYAILVEVTAGALGAAGVDELLFFVVLVYVDTNLLRLSWLEAEPLNMLIVVIFEVGDDGLLVLRVFQSDRLDFILAGNVACFTGAALLTRVERSETPEVHLLLLLAVPLIFFLVLVQRLLLVRITNLAHNLGLELKLVAR